MLTKCCLYSNDLNEKKLEKSEKCRDSKFDINENVDNQI